MISNEFTSDFVTAQDGLRLHLRIYGRRTASGFPVVCLPGLARTSADFHELARTLSADPDLPRRVIAMDYRGRGRSEHDSNAANYSIAIELADILTVLTAL